MAEASISLGQLLNHLVQSTYHDLSLLSELLPTKQDTERKIKLAHFAKKTNYQFVRFLAIAYWASSRDVSKSLESFTSGLDEQSDFYIDTANFCFQQTQELRHCGIPRYCIVSAIDILRTCNFTFLPTCISKRLISLPPLTPSEKLDTRDKLDQNLRLRLISLLPTLPQTLTPHLKLSPKGCLRMHIPHQFDARFTLMIGFPATPWKLYHLDFLVHGTQSVGERSLVLPFQKSNLQALVQHYLFNQDVDNVLVDAYNLLHSFTQSLQLHILCMQLIHITEHWGRLSFKVEEYIPGEKLRIGYWYKSYYLQSSSSITVSASQTKPNLVYSHSESLPKSDATSTLQPSNPQTNEIELDSEQLFIDKLIHTCTEVKCLHSLQTIQKCLEAKNWPFPVLLLESPPSLTLSMGFDDLPDKLEVLMDPCYGHIKCIINSCSVSAKSSLATLSSSDERTTKIQAQLEDLAKALLENVALSAELLTQFRAQFRLWSYEQQAMEMDMCVSFKLPLVNEDALPNASLCKAKENRIASFHSRLYIQLHTPHHYLIISLSQDLNAPILGFLVESVYIMETCPVSFSFQHGPILVPRIYGLDNSSYIFLSVYKVYQLTPEYGISIGNDFSNFVAIDPLQRRRLQNFGARFYYYSISNMTKSPNYFFRLLHQVDALVSIFCLQSAFTQIGCNEHYLLSTMDSSAHSLVLTKPLCPSFVSKSMYARFCKQLLFCRFHLVPFHKMWLVQVSFSSPLLYSTKSQFNLNYNTLNYGESLCENFSTDWLAVLVLFRSLVEYSVYFESCKLIQNCSRVLNYSYTRVSLSFSSNDPEFYQESKLDIAWNSQLSKFQLIFTNSPYALAKFSLEEVFNSNYSIPQLIAGLIKLFPLYKVLEQSKISNRQFKVGFSPAIVRFVFRMAIDIEYLNLNTVKIHIQKQDPTELVLVLLNKFIDFFGDANHPDPASLQTPAVARTSSKASPAYSHKDFSPGPRYPPLSQSPHASSKPNPLFPISSATLSKSTYHFFPPNDLDNITPAFHPQPTKTINYSTLQLLLLPGKMESHLPPLCTFLGVAYLLDYERLVKFLSFADLDPSRKKFEAGSLSIQFDKVTISIFLEPNFTDIGIKLSINDTIDTHTILRDQDIQALVTFFHSSKIKSPVFSVNALLSYLTLMSSSSLIKTAAYIFRHSHTPMSEWLWLPELCLTVPDSPHYKPTTEVSIKPGMSCLNNIANKGYMLYLRLLPQKQELKSSMDLILLYDYKQNIIELKTYGISAGHTKEYIGNAIRKILSRVNANKEPDSALMLAVREISKHLVI